MPDRLPNHSKLVDIVASTLEVFNRGMKDTLTGLSQKVNAFYADEYRPSRDPLSKLINRMGYFFPIVVVDLARIPIGVAELSSRAALGSFKRLSR